MPDTLPAHSLPCPNCAGPGIVRAIQVTRDERTLSYRCDTCHHEWDVIDTYPRRSWSGRLLPGSGAR